MKTIISRQNRTVLRYRKAADRHQRELVLLDGLHLIGEAIQAGMQLVGVAFSGTGMKLSGAEALAREVESQGTEVLSVSDEVLRAMTPVRTPSGVVALARRPGWTIEQAFVPEPPLVLVGVDVQDPGNAGAMIRAAEAAGATAAVFTGASADPFGWKALRGAMGSAFRLPTLTATTDDVFEAAHARGVKVAATVPRGGVPPCHAELGGPLVLLFGGEGPGLAASVVERTDMAVTIPMREPVESLNVSVAAALVLYEASRQRGFGPPGSPIPNPRSRRGSVHGER
jgi:TrmH family RNA methyltransferase